MIKLLHIENIAVIEKADIEFSSGLNVLTGETGAGKSIVIDALSAVTGSRTSRDVIRTGADYASVTAVFVDVGELPWFENNGVTPDESGELYVTRKISTDGKSVTRVNGVPVSITQLRELGSALLDIHGQNDGRKLLDENAHLSYLDAFGELDEQLDLYKSAYASYLSKQKEVDRLVMDESSKAERIDALRFRIEEIERAKLRVGEQEELSARRELLRNASKLTDSVEAAFEALYGGDNSDGVIALVDEARSHLEYAAGYSEGLLAAKERLVDMRYSAQDISDELRDFREKLDFSPGELDELESRIDVISRVVRKYGSEEKALEILEHSKIEVSDIEDSENRLSKLEHELESCYLMASNAADSLSDLRNSVAGALQSKVMDELSQLNMPGVEFLVTFDVVKGDKGLGPFGRDEVYFLMSANAGERPGRINRIASGGELARIMLALKNVLSADRDSCAMVFDEIDTGVSGVAAQRVGEKLSMLAHNRQVLCVTHLPQIAVMADTHFGISKSTSDGRTYTFVEQLDFDGRKVEIARLSGGENVTATMLISAEEQLESARIYKERLYV